MSKHGTKIALVLGMAGMALFAGNAQALTDQECTALPSNQFLAAIERGSCRIDIETAAGPDTADNSDDGHNGRDGGGDHGKGGGERNTGGGNPNGGRPGKP
jgi:hypothetical protein